MRSDVSVVRGDISASMLRAAKEFGSVACDIETSGLDWLSDSIATCQLHVPGFGAEIIRIEDVRPVELVSLVEDEQIRKIFHHAPFDLRFMRHCWDARARNVACTKISAKIALPELEAREYSLKPLLKAHLGVDIDKALQTSNWLSADLTDGQLEYAARDVLYLHDLLDVVLGFAKSAGVTGLVKSTFDYIPIRVETDLRGVGDVFSH